MLYFRADSPFKTIGDIIKAKEPPKCGASGFASSGYILPKVLEETVGAKFNVIVGYAGGKEIDLAVEKGEVICRGHDVSSHFGREPFNSWHGKRYDRHLVQDARTRDPRLPEAPTIWEIMNEYKTPQVSRSVAETVLTANDFGRAMIASPGTRPDLVKILRAAYAQALKDPEVLAEIKKSNLDVEYTAGEQLQKLAHDVMDQSPEVIERVKKVLGE
jgi:tripartite-type tricarboxylate transporter receptor subunit TctC